MNAKELEDMVRVTSECGVKFTVHHQRKYDPDFQTIKKVYEGGKLGDVFLVKSSLYGYNGNMHDWHVFLEEGGGMLYDWGVHLIDQMLYLRPNAKVLSVYADIRNVINQEVDDYFKILLKFDNGILGEVELGTYLLSDQTNQKWFERHWMVGGNQGTAYVNGFDPIGKIVHTTKLLQNVSGKRTMTAAGPTRSFGTPPEGIIVTEELPVVTTCHRDYFENYKKAYAGEEAFLVQIPETKRVLRIMEAARESARTGQSIAFGEV